MATNPYTELQKQRAADLENQKKAQLGELEQEANKQSQQAYVRLLQQQQATPTQAMLAGRTGGAAQTLAAQPQMAYNQALQQIGTEKIRGISDIGARFNTQAVQDAISFVDKILGYETQQEQTGFERAKYAASVGDVSKLQQYGIAPQMAPETPTVPTTPTAIDTSQVPTGLRFRETKHTYLLVDESGRSQNYMPTIDGVEKILIGDKLYTLEEALALQEQGIIRLLENPGGSKYLAKVK